MNTPIRTHVLALAALWLAAGGASAASLTTTFASNNSQNGNMFDVVTAGNTLTVTSFDVNASAGTHTIELYTRPGTWQGFENDSAGWTLVGSGSVTSAGAGQPTTFDAPDFVLPNNATTALYLTISTGGNLHYTNGTTVGAVTASNSDLSILEGAGKEYAFAATFPPRIWNGTIVYTVPEPSAAGLLVGTSFLALRRRRRCRA